MPFLRKYATGSGADVYVPIIKRGVVDFAVGADWTPANGDVKISIDGGSAANIGTLPVAVAMGNAAYWKFVFSDAELTGKKIIVTVADSATKAVEDQAFIVETFGHASALFPTDYSVASTAQTGDSYARIGANGAGLTALGDTRLAELEAGNLPTDIAAVKSDTAAILLDTGTDGVVVAAGSKSDYALSSAGVTAVQSGLATSSALSTLSSYVDTEVTAIKAVTDELDPLMSGGAFTEAALANAPTGGAAGDGDNTVTITLQRSDGTKLPNRNVTAKNAAQTAVLATGTSDANGQVVFNLSNGSPKIIVGSQAADVTLAAQTLTVSGTTSATYTITAASTSPSTEVL